MNTLYGLWALSSPTRDWTQALWMKALSGTTRPPGNPMLAELLQSHLTLCNPMDCSLPGSSIHGDSPGKNTGVGCQALRQRIFPTQGSNLPLSPALAGGSLPLVPPSGSLDFHDDFEDGREVYFVCTGANSLKPFEHILFPPALQSYDFSLFSDPPFHTFVPCLFFPLLNHPPLLISKPFMISAIWLSPASTFKIFQTPRPTLLREL